MYKKGVELRADGFDILVVEYDFFFHVYIYSIETEGYSSLITFFFPSCTHNNILMFGYLLDVILNLFLSSILLPPQPNLQSSAESYQTRAQTRPSFIIDLLHLIRTTALTIHVEAN